MELQRGGETNTVENDLSEVLSIARFFLLIKNRNGERLECHRIENIYIHVFYFLQYLKNWRVNG
jgi:hypothetical protein